MPRRRTQWMDNNFGALIANGGDDVQDLRGPLGLRDIQGSTITRIVGSISIHSATIAGAYGVQRVSIGIGVASEEAVTANVVADPETEGDVPAGGWLTREVRVIGQNGTGTWPVDRWQFDLRAQRKLVGGVPFLVLENTNLTGTSFTIRFDVNIRILLILP